MKKLFSGIAILALTSTIAFAQDKMEANTSSPGAKPMSTKGPGAPAAGGDVASEAAMDAGKKHASKKHYKNKTKHHKNKDAVPATETPSAE